MKNLWLSRADAAKATKRILASERTHAALILILILNILFFPCIWGNQTMLESAQLWPSIMPTGSWAGKPEPFRWGKTADGAAAAWFFEPYLSVVAHDYFNGTTPLWNPYQAYGQPVAAGMQAQPFFPLTMLLTLHFTERTYNLFLLARLFIAGFFAYLFLSLFVDFLPALAGGIAMMLGGYYILEMVMPHISVEMLTPAALFAGERLLRLRTYGSVVAFALVLFLINLGGMPESALLSFALVFSYLVFRVIIEIDTSDWLAVGGKIAYASVTALGLSSIVLLPFLEFLRHGYTSHDFIGAGRAIPGTFSYWFSSNVFNYLLPLLYGPYRELSNEFGILAFFLLLIALFSLFAKPAVGADKLNRLRLRSLSFFFLTCLIFLAMKRYGVPGINGFGRLPLFRLTDLYKYDEALITVCVAMLCGIGAQQLLKRVLPKPLIAVALGISFAMIPLAVFLGQGAIIDEIKAGIAHVPAKFPEFAVALAVSILFCLAICLWMFDKRPKYLAMAIVVLLATELSLNFITVIYYVDDHLATHAKNPYVGAPYVKFLKQHTSGLERIFGRESVLYPNWASVFQLNDIRDLDAMYFWRYLPFLRNFIQPRPFARASELWDRFTGAGLPYAFNSVQERRLLQLSSVKYVITMTPYSAPPFKLVYDHEVKIYEVPDILPRASLFYRAEVARDAGEALKRLADPAFDISGTAVLEGPRQSPEAPALESTTSRPVDAAEIISYSPAAVEIHASSSRDSILVLNDAVYPGWNVTVDGRPQRILTVNYLFRGVALKAGRHTVRFVYRPKPFYIGLIIAGIAALALFWPALQAIAAERKSLRTRADVAR